VCPQQSRYGLRADEVCASAGKYVMRGVLRYKARDNAQCFPPKTLPVSFDVKVVKAKTTGGRNSAQRSHVHN
jgi:hypothetical protein